MAGQYYYDPRPFYGHNGSNGLMPLDELFYGRYEPVPYWMDQRMTPVTAFDDYYYKQMAMGRPPPPQLQQYAYKRPESRDDIYTDMYRHSLHNHNGPMSYGGRQTRDDGWVHAMTPHQDHGYHPGATGPGNHQYRPAPMGHMPNDTMAGARGMEMIGPMSNNGNMRGNYMSNMGNMGSSNTSYGNGGSNKQMSNQFSNKSGGFAGGGNNGYSGYENVKSSSLGGKGTNSKQGGGKANMSVRFAESDSSSEDDSDDDEYGSRSNNGGRKGSGKGGNGGHNFAQKTVSKGSGKHGHDSHSSQNMMSSKPKSGGNHGGNRGSNHGSTQSGRITKMLRFQDADSSSSDSDDERYGHNMKSSKASSKASSHGSHGSHSHSNHGSHSHGHQQQSKQMSYGSSQSKGVELKVPICCDNCERKVRECLEYMDGVENVLCDQWNRKVIVYGNVKPDTVLKRVKKVKKGSELWQQGKQQQQMLRVF